MDVMLLWHLLTNVTFAKCNTSFRFAHLNFSFAWSIFGLSPEDAFGGEFKLDLPRKRRKKKLV